MRLDEDADGRGGPGHDAVGMRWLTALGGFHFGTIWGGPCNLVGAALIFHAAKTNLGIRPSGFVIGTLVGIGPAGFRQHEPRRRVGRRRSAGRRGHLPAPRRPPVAGLVVVAPIRAATRRLRRPLPDTGSSLHE